MLFKVASYSKINKTGDIGVSNVEFLVILKENVTSYYMVTHLIIKKK